MQRLYYLYQHLPAETALLKEILFFTTNCLISRPTPCSVQMLVGLRLLAYALSTFSDSTAMLGQWMYHAPGEDSSFETEIFIRLFQALNVVKQTHKEAIEQIAIEYDLHTPIVKLLQQCN